MRPLLGLTSLQGTFARRILSYSGKMYLNRTIVLPTLPIRFVAPLVEISIASMWSSHFSQLFNCVKCDRHKNYTMEAVKLITNDYDTFTPGDINRSIASLCSDKACGKDVLFAEHLLHASPQIHVLLSICFNAFIVHVLLPNPLTDTVLVPIVKDNTKNISDKGNYRPIALASVVSKVEMSLRVKLESFLHSSDYQFGFKANHSTDLCIYTLKEVIDFYKSQSTSIYGCV